MQEAVLQIFLPMLYLLPAALIALPVHEFAHGYMSYLLGDPTAKQEGRLTLNPFRHLDPVGFVLLLLVRFGWAKPVPINPMYYKHRKRGIILVSVAGPASNLILAFLTLLILKLIGNMVIANSVMLYLATFLEYFASLNITLAIFNLIPIPPLDGSKILLCALPLNAAYTFARFERYSFLVIIVLSFTGILGYVISFFYQYIARFFVFILNLF